MSLITFYFSSQGQTDRLLYSYDDLNTKYKRHLKNVIINENGMIVF